MSTHVACRLWHTFLLSLTKYEQTLCDYNRNDDYCQNTKRMQKHKPLNKDTSKPAHTNRYGRQKYSCTYMNARTFKHIHKTHIHTDTHSAICSVFILYDICLLSISLCTVYILFILFGSMYSYCSNLTLVCSLFFFLFVLCSHI